MNTKVEQFINGTSRNKLIISHKLAELINPVDVGFLFSSKINQITEDRRLPLKAKMILEGIFESILYESDNFGKLLAIKNLGILFEPELKLDIYQLLDKHSRNNALFIQWDGVIENNNLYFLTKEKGQKINIKHLSHIII